jgi:hypothetical protein
VGDPKAKPQFEILAERLEELTNWKVEVRKGEYPHPVTERKMISFTLVITRGKDVIIFNTARDYSEIGVALRYMVRMAEGDLLHTAL